MRFQLNQKVVYWAPAPADDYGRPTAVEPVELPARWEDNQSQQIDKDGAMFMSAATVYLVRSVQPGGILFLGTLADLPSGITMTPKTSSLCREIGTASSVPSLRNTQSLITAYLK